MTSPPESMSIDAWLDLACSRFRAAAPELLSLFETYAGEAAQGRKYLDEELRKLKPGAKILEVGAGSMLLSCQLVREGYVVAALEPIGSGFSHFDRMRQLVLELASEQGCTPEVLPIQGENLDARDQYDLAFSINVMEHVGDVGKVISKVTNSLKPGATYRFTCPNYSFPYETHFGIPTLFSRRLTERFMRDMIFNSTRIKDPAGLWASLNWITVSSVRSHVRKLPECRLAFNKEYLATTLERALSDPTFAARQSGPVRSVAAIVVKSGLHRALTHIPAAWHPLMDCIITRTTVPGRA